MRTDVAFTVPRAKQLYITLDTKREAEDAGVAFGRICDPVGRPVERCFSLYPFAVSKARGAALLREFLVASFAEGIDTGSEDGLRQVVTRAGLSFEEARPHLDGEGWRDELERNREQLFALGTLAAWCNLRLDGPHGIQQFITLRVELLDVLGWRLRPA